MAGLGPAINAIANRGSVGAPPPPANESIEPPAYDVAHDPGWGGWIDPTNHAERNFVNALDDAQRQMLRQMLMHQRQQPPLPPGQQNPGRAHPVTPDNSLFSRARQQAIHDTGPITPIPTQVQGAGPIIPA